VVIRAVRMVSGRWMRVERRWGIELRYVAILVELTWWVLMSWKLIFKI